MKRGCLHLRDTRSYFYWHIDSMMNLGRCGFSFHGCVGGFSQVTIWPEVQRSNENPRLMEIYFLNNVKAAHECASRVYTDRGT